MLDFKDSPVPKHAGSSNKEGIHLYAKIAAGNPTSVILPSGVKSGFPGFSVKLETTANQRRMQTTENDGTIIIEQI